MPAAMMRHDPAIPLGIHPPRSRRIHAFCLFTPRGSINQAEDGCEPPIPALTLCPSLTFVLSSEHHCSACQRLLFDD